jgi:outer membrane protein
MHRLLQNLMVLTATVVSIQNACANDLLEVYQLALARDTTLQTAVAQRDAAIEKRPQAISQLLPQVLATGSATRERIMGETIQTASGVSANCTQSTDGLQRCTGDSRGYRLSVTQKLWSVEAFYQLRGANRQAASAEATLLGAQQSLQLRVARAYFGILAAKDQLTATGNEREAFGVLLEQAKGREQTGVGPRSDVEQAQAFYDATEQSVIDARNSLDDASLALTEIVGSHRADIAPLREDIPLIPPDPASVDQWVSIAQEENPLLRAAQLRIDAASYEITAQRGKGLPVVSVVTSSSRSWQDPALGGNERLDTVGISIDWPLFQGGAVSSSIRESRALYHQAQADYETARRNTETQVRTAFRGVVTGIQRIAASRRAVESARASVAASKRNVEFGTGTQFDLLNAQNNYSAAQRAYSQTRYDYLTSWLSLKLQSGRLTKDDLATIDELLVPQGP